jgi:hypothetical protein
VPTRWQHHSRKLWMALCKAITGPLGLVDPQWRIVYMKPVWTIPYPLNSFTGFIDILYERLPPKFVWNFRCSFTLIYVNTSLHKSVNWLFRIFHIY